MRTLLLSFTVLLSMSATQLAAGQSAKKPAPSKSSTAKSSTAKKSSSKKSSKTASSQKKKTTAVQQHPTPERYAEIQQALVNRGYLEQADGQWDADSIEALKKFQQDQELKADGKLGALSLMALGLGPRRGAFAVAAQVPNLGTPTSVE